MGKARASVNEDVIISRELSCKLTEEELLERGDRMAAAELAIEVLKGKRKLQNAEISAQVELRAELAHTIESGVEDRDVKCKWIGNFTTNQWALIRQDTGEEVESRAMTAQDRQAGFPFEGDAVSAAGSAADGGEDSEDDELDLDDYGGEVDSPAPPRESSVVPKPTKAKRKVARTSKATPKAAKSKPKTKAPKKSNRRAA